MNRKLLTVVFLVGFFSCIKDVTINEKNTSPEVVLNCILNADKDTVTVQLTHSRPIQSTIQFEAIKDANILFFEEGKNVGEFIWTDSSTYVLPVSIVPGKTYRLEAKTKNKIVWAETTVPSIVNASIENANPESYSYSYLISLKDNREEDNFYWVSATGYEGVEDNKQKNIACVLYSNFEYTDDFNQGIYQNGMYKFEYKYYIRFTDNELSGDLTEVIFYPQCITYPKEVFLLSADYHLDKYMKASLMLQEMDLYAEDMPIIYSPFPIYSNIHGGTGIFGSFSSVSKVFTND